MSTKKPKKPLVSGQGRKIGNNPIVPLTTIGIVLLLVVSSLLSQKESFSVTTSYPSNTEQEIGSNSIDLSHPSKNSRVSIEQALSGRRSYRSFKDEPVSFSHLSQLLWSAQGVTVSWGGRTVPSSKSVYPLSIYAVANQVVSLDPGLYKYNPGDLQPAHQLYTLYKANLQQLFLENTDQYSLQHAPLVLVITGNMNKMAEQYDDQRKDIEVYLEAGHTAQNLFLQSESLGLGMATIRNFNQDLLKEILQISEDETIIYLIPVGHPTK